MPNNNFTYIATLQRLGTADFTLSPIFTFGIPGPAIALIPTVGNYPYFDYVGRVFGFAYVNLGTTSNTPVAFQLGVLSIINSVYTFNPPTQTASNGQICLYWGRDVANVSVDVYISN